MIEYFSLATCNTLCKVCIRTVHYTLCPDARLQFTESDYTSTETEMTISPSVQLLTNIATDLTVVAVAVNYTFLNDSRSPLLGVIPDVADYNPRRPINATSK